MRRVLIISLIAFAVSCSHSGDGEVARLMSQIDSLYAQGRYRETLDSIVSLRSNYPKALEARKKALRVWREASLKLAQADIAYTDSSLQATLRQIDGETNLYRANMLRARRDSLQARYEAMCGVVKMIRIKQKEE